MRRDPIQGNAVPHYGMKEREFCTLPACWEIAPEVLQLPDGTELNELLKVVDQNGLNVWQQ